MSSVYAHVTMEPVFWIYFVLILMSPDGTSCVGAEGPDQLEVVKTTNDSITVQWNATEASEYKVLWTYGSIEEEDFTADTILTIGNLQSGNLYQVSVSACDEDRNCTGVSASIPVITQPNKPYNLSLSVSSANLLAVSWIPGNSVLEINHTVVVTRNNSEVVRVQTEMSSYVVDQMEADTFYQVTVISHIKDSPQTRSEMVEDSIWTYPAPATLQVKPFSDWLEITWDKASASNHELFVFDDDIITCTRVQFGHSPFTPCEASSCAAKPQIESSSSYNLTGSEPCGRYRVRFYAVNPVGCSNQTEVSVISPSAEPREQIQNLILTNVTKNSMNVSWPPITNPERCEKTYTVRYSFVDCPSGEINMKNFTNIMDTYLVIDNLTPYTNYTFTVEANTSNSGPGISTSERVIQMTKEDVPGRPTMITYNETNGNLLWLQPECEANGVIRFYAVDYFCYETDRPDILKETKLLYTVVPFLEVNFKPFRTCSVNITALTIGYGDKSDVIIYTSEKPPGKVVFNYTDLTNTSIELAWEEPEERNGVITGYTVQWKESVSLEWNSAELNETVSSYSIEGLTPYTEYNVSVFANNSAGHGASDYLSMSSLTGLPSVVNVTVLAVRNTSISMEWDEPVDKNGVILRYTIQWTDLDKANLSMNYELDPDVFNHTLDNLTAYTTYNMEVFASTSAGRGASSPFNVSTLTGLPGKIDVNVSDVSNTTISLAWDEPAVKNGVILNYTVQWMNSDNSNQSEAWPVNPTIFNYTISNLKAYTNYTIEVFANTSAGRGASDPLTVPTLTGLPSIVNVTVVDVTNTSILLAWEEPEEKNGVILSYSVHLMETDNSSLISSDLLVLDPNASNHTIRDLTPYTNYTLDIYANTSAGRGASDLFTVFTLTGLPGMVNLTIDNLTDTSISVSWLPPVRANGIIVNYTVEWMKENSSEVFGVALNPEIFNCTIHDLDPYTYYNVSVYANTSAGAGEMAEVKLRTRPSPGMAIPVINLDVTVDEAYGLRLEIFWEREYITGPTNYLVCTSEVGYSEECQFSITVPADESEIYSTSIEVAIYYWDYYVQVSTYVAQEDGNVSVAITEKAFVKTGRSNPGIVSNFVAQSLDEIDCRRVTFEWTALDPRYHNGIFQNYTIVSSQAGSGNLVTVSVDESSITTASAFLDGGHRYTCSMFAMNDAYKGESADYEIQTSTCVPILEGTGADLVQESRNPVEDKQRTYRFTYDDNFFTNQSFGQINNFGFLVRDVTEENNPAFKRTLTEVEFLAEYIHRWADYNQDFAQSYRIDNPEAGTESSKVTRGEISTTSIQEYLLGSSGECGGFCNGYLKPAKSYRFQLFSCTSGGCLITQDAQISVITSAGGIDGLTVGLSTIGALLGVAVIVIAVLVYRYKDLQKKKQSSPEIQESATDETFASNNRIQDSGQMEYDDLYDKINYSTMLRKEPDHNYYNTSCTQNIHLNVLPKDTSAVTNDGQYETPRPATIETFQSESINHTKNPYLNIKNEQLVKKNTQNQEGEYTFLFDQL